LPCALTFYLDRLFDPAFGVIERATYASMCATFHDKPVSGAFARDVYDAFAEYRIAVSSQRRQRASIAFSDVVLVSMM
jgi:hypothetical protein